MKISTLTKYVKLSLLSVLLLVVTPITATELSHLLSLESAISAAQQNDPWIAENRHVQAALESRSIAAGTLPDPRVSIGLANIAADSFDFNQEAMTQMRVGVSQMFPRGNTLQLQTQQLQLLNTQNPLLRADRKRLISTEVTRIWFEIFRSKESIRLIEKDRVLFEQLVEISEASYASAYGSTKQQDVVRAQLELTRLDDRLTQLSQQQESAQKQLSQWVSGQFVTEYLVTDTAIPTVTNFDINNSVLPEVTLLYSELLTIRGEELHDALLKHLVNHPAVLALESRIKASSTQIEIEKQKYQPEWGIEAKYGYRGNNALGENRSDLFSLGVSFDVPLFTEKRQDKYVQAAVSNAESIKTKKWLLLRKMIAEFETAKVGLLRLNQRFSLYQDQLLPQIQEQAEAALTAYTNDAGDFSEVVRARIDVLDAEIDQLDIITKRYQVISKINYYLSEANNFSGQGK